MRSSKISVIIPVVRPESAARCIESVRKQLPGAEVVTEVDADRVGCPAMVDLLTRKASRPWVLFLGDDTELADGFASALADADADLPDGWGLIGLNTDVGKPCAHWLAHRNLLDILPENRFFSLAYRHGYCDDELRDIADENGRWVFCPGARVIHHHPSDGRTPADDTHAWARDQLSDDFQIYIRRKRSRRNKLAIGFPLVDATVPVQFFTSFACMEKPAEYVLLVPQFPHGPWTGSIADARNSLVHQARMEGASRLLMLDTDQVYPPDTLTRLMGHGLDICGVRVHRRWMPFDPIFYRGEIGRYQNVPDEEAYSGRVIEVDATGTGCLLFDMAVFDRIEAPWFAFDVRDGNPVGEDICFCGKARESGIRIHVDTGIEVGHLTTMEVTRTLHQICKVMRQKPL